MAVELRRSEIRGMTRTSWLKSFHSFSFADYYDPANMNFGPLIVLNDDVIAPKSGFGMHYHKNAEIVTIVLKGLLFHRDSHGFQETIRAGEVQKMSAGSGVEHAEMNPSPDEEVHLLQIWLTPRTNGGSFSYQSRSFSSLLANKLSKIVSGSDKSVLTINQSAEFFIGFFLQEITFSHVLNFNNAYVFVIEGSFRINGTELNEGDAMKVIELNELSISSQKNSRLLIIEF